MKKYIFFFLTILIFGLVAPIRAEEESEPSLIAPRNQIRQEVMEENQNRVMENADTENSQRTEVKDRVKTRLEEFKAKLGLIKDEKKQKLAERINTNLTHLNQQITTNLSHLLTRLRALMDKLNNRVGQAKIEGLSTTKAEEAMTIASTLIVKAEKAVAVQAENEYVIEFADEAGLKIGANTAKQQLKADLEAVRELVREARQAVVDVLQELELLYQ